MQGNGRPSNQLGRLMRRMMAPTMTLDTISKIRMVLAVWLMPMRIARWAGEEELGRYYDDLEDEFEREGEGED